MRILTRLERSGREVIEFGLGQIRSFVAEPYLEVIASFALPGAGETDTLVAQWNDGVDEGFRISVLPADDACANCLNFEIGDGVTTPATVCDVDASTKGALTAARFSKSSAAS